MLSIELQLISCMPNPRSGNQKPRSTHVSCFLTSNEKIFVWPPGGEIFPKWRYDQLQPATTTTTSTKSAAAVSSDFYSTEEQTDASAIARAAMAAGDAARAGVQPSLPTAANETMNLLRSEWIALHGMEEGFVSGG